MSNSSATLLVTILLGALLAMPLTAQEPDAPGPPAEAPQAPAERLERLRFERMQEILELNEQQMQALRKSMQEARKSHVEAQAEARAAMERLRRELANQPVREDAVRQALEALEAQRQTMGRLREEHRLDIEQHLSAEQRAKFLLFNRQFDTRLRELIEQHRGGRRLAPDAQRGPGQAGRLQGRGRSGVRSPGEASPARLRQQIVELERRQQELQRRLEEMEKDGD